MYTINTYDINGKYTLMQPFILVPMYFETRLDAEAYAKFMDCDFEEISIEECE